MLLKPFSILYFVKNQVYKLKLSKKKKIYDLFHVLLLKQDIFRKKRADKIAIKLNFKTSNSKKDKMETI